MTVVQQTTGISGLDEVLNGGIPKHTLTLLAGTSGTGKTILSLQWLFDGVKHGENGIYISITEPLFMAIRNIESMKFYDRKAIEEEKLRVFDIREGLGLDHEPIDSQSILCHIEKQVKEKPEVIDSKKSKSSITETSIKQEKGSFDTSKSADFESAQKPKVFDMAKIKEEIELELKGGKLKKHEAQIKEQRAPITHFLSEVGEEKGKKFKRTGREHIKVGVPGFDELFESGIPKGSSVLVAGGAGSGKTIFCLQTLINKASEGKKCFYMSFEESENNLIEHMEGFGWNPKELIKNRKLKIQRFNPFDITRNVDALLAKEKGELKIDIEPVLLPEDFKPEFIVLDSLTAVASAFVGKEDSYRLYIEQLFRFFEKTGSTTFLITETQQIPEIFSTTGVEEFLADGVIVLYNIKKGDVRESAIEVLKMHGEKHQKKIVAMQITNDGIVVYPEQEVFSEM